MSTKTIKRVVLYIGPDKTSFKQNLSLDAESSLLMHSLARALLHDALLFPIYYVSLLLKKVVK